MSDISSTFAHDCDTFNPLSQYLICISFDKCQNPCVDVRLRTFLSLFDTVTDTGYERLHMTIFVTSLHVNCVNVNVIIPVVYSKVHICFQFLIKYLPATVSLSGSGGLSILANFD